MKIAGIPGEMHVRSGGKVATFDLVSHPDELMRRKGIQLVFEDFLVEEEPVTLAVYVTDGFLEPIPVGRVHIENEAVDFPGGHRPAFKRRLYFPLTEALARMRNARRIEVILRAFDVQGKEEKMARFKPGHLSLAIPAEEKEV